MIYEYECRSCNLRFTAHRKVAERDEPAMCECGGRGRRLMGTPRMIANSDSFPSHDYRDGKFWQPDGRRMYMKERNFLEREAADDAAAAPETVTNVVKQRAGIGL